MPEWLLRVEAVNLGNFVYDTTDLSTTRGGGLLLLNAIDWLAPHALAAMKTVLTPISTGASSGLFSFQAADGEGLRADIDRFLRTDDRLRHATFVTSVIAASAAFPEDVESLIAANRWQQMQSASLAIPVRGQSSDSACAIDRVRPGVVPRTFPDRTEKKISACTDVRREYGREQKRHFHAMELDRLAKMSGVDGTATGTVRGEVAAHEFVQHLEELTSAPARGNLHLKMALIYIDGNGFGKIQAGLGREALEKWDRDLKRYRRLMLRDLLATFPSDAGWQTEDSKWRFETLLWGGDEMMWVVPAWKGWETLQLFFEHTRTWEFDGQPLKHAAGMVFCHHNAPIQRIIALAHELAELAKKDRTRDLFAYQVLETFDHVAGDLDGFRKKRIPQGAAVSDLILDAEATAAIQHSFAIVKEKLPNNKLHEIVLSQRRDPARAAALMSSVTRAAFGDRTSLAELEAVQKAFGGGDTAWFHLADLWDYIPTPAALAEVVA